MSGGFDTLVLEGERVRIEMMPEIGAKVTSLCDQASGREWLSRPAAPYRPAHLDADFGDYDRSGWDECFPSIGAGVHPTPPWRGSALADHGELWSRPWQCWMEDESIVCCVEGARFPYRFERRLSIAGPALHADYTVTNLAEQPLPCVWAMHPLLAAEPGMRVLLAPGTRMSVDSALGVDLGCLQRFDWPFLRTNDGREFDLSELRPPGEGFGVKVFAEHLHVRRAALLDPHARAWLALDFDSGVVRHLGIWLNQGAWPSDCPLYHVALEPATGCADHLDVAMRLGDVSVVPPLGSLSWRVSFVVGEGEEALEAFLAADVREPSPN